MFEKKKQIIILFFGNSFLYASRAIIPLAIKDISNDYGWTRFQSGIALSSFFWGYSLTQFVAGIMADVYGGSVIIQKSTFGWATLTIALPISVKLLKNIIDPIHMFIICRILTGGFQGFFYPSLSSVSSQMFGSEKSIAYSCIVSGSYFGTVICGGLGSYCLSIIGWSWTFYLFGILSILWNLIYMRSTIDDYQIQILPKPVVMKESLFSIIIWESAFWALIFGYLCQNVAFSILFSWLPTFFRDKHPTAKSWVVNVLPWLISMPFTVVGGRICSRLTKGHSLDTTRKLAAFISLVCTGMCLFALSLFSDSLVISLIILMTALSCYSLNTVGLMINPQDICPDNAGAVFGFMNMIGAIPGFAGVLVVGSFLEKSNNDWNQVFRCTSVICIVGYIVYYIFGTARRIM